MAEGQTDTPAADAAGAPPAQTQTLRPARGRASAIPTGARGKRPAQTGPAGSTGHERAAERATQQEPAPQGPEAIRSRLEALKESETAAKKQPTAFVMEKSRGDKPRTHQLRHPVSGRTVDFTFNPGQATAIPLDIAAQLVGNEHFEVRDEDGVILRRALQRSRLGGDVTLRSDEVVAKYDDLVQGKLEELVEFEGGDIKEIGRARERMIAWLKRHRELTDEEESRRLEAGGGGRREEEETDLLDEEEDRDPYA